MLSGGAGVSPQSTLGFNFSDEFMNDGFINPNNLTKDTTGFNANLGAGGDEMMDLDGNNDLDWLKFDV